MVPLAPPPSPNRKTYPFVGTARVAGLVVHVENAAGSTRRGVDPDGHAWAVKMKAGHYGEIAGTEGSDGEPVDAYVGPDVHAPTAYVVHQKVPGTQRHDEDKVMLGYPSQAAAVDAYRGQYDRPGFYGGCTPWPVAELATYLRRHEHKGKRLDSPERVQAMLKAEARTLELVGEPLEKGILWVKPHEVDGHAVRGHWRHTTRQAIPHGDVAEGERVTLPKSRDDVRDGSIAWGKDAEVTVDHDPDGVTSHVRLVGHPGGSHARMPRASVSHFLNDQRGTFAESPTSGHRDVDAVIRGEGQLLGKGNDGIVYRHGDKVVKASTTTPYQPFNPGHRTPEGAAAHLRTETTAHEALRGIPHVPAIEHVDHEGRHFIVKDHYHRPGKLSAEELASVDRAVRAMHERGWALGDQVQLGRDDKGALWFEDLGSAHQGVTANDRRSDEEHLDALYRESDGGPRPKWHGAADEPERRKTLNAALFLHKPGDPGGRLRAAFDTWDASADDKLAKMPHKTDAEWAAYDAEYDKVDALRRKARAALGIDSFGEPLEKASRVLVLSRLRKSQLGMFRPIIGGAVNVKAHTRVTEHGVELVREHQEHRRLHVDELRAIGRAAMERPSAQAAHATTAPAGTAPTPVSGAAGLTVATHGHTVGTSTPSRRDPGGSMRTLTITTPHGEFTRKTDSPYTHAVVWASPRAKRVHDAANGSTKGSNGVDSRWIKDRGFAVTWHKTEASARAASRAGYTYDSNATLVGVFPVNT